MAVSAFSNSPGAERILFLRVDEYEQGGTIDWLEQEESGTAVVTPFDDPWTFGIFDDVLGYPKYMCEGEREGEILATAEDRLTGENLVVRVCIPNTVCDSFQRRASMLLRTTSKEYAGIAKVEDTYLVAERKSLGNGVVYQCPIGKCRQRSECREEDAGQHDTPPTPRLIPPLLPQLRQTCRYGAAPSLRTSPRETTGILTP